jgi:hypothetical protein
VLCVVTLTDKETRVCVDPGGNGATMNAGEKGDPARLAGEKISS